MYRLLSTIAVAIVMTTCAQTLMAQPSTIFRGPPRGDLVDRPADGSGLGQYTATDCDDSTCSTTGGTIWVTFRWNGSAWEISGSGGGSGSTNLGYTPSPTHGTVTSSSGANATLSIAGSANAGLMAPGDFSKLFALPRYYQPDGFTGADIQAKLDEGNFENAFGGAVMELPPGTYTGVENLTIPTPFFAFYCLGELGDCVLEAPSDITGSSRTILIEPSAGHERGMWIANLELDGNKDQWTSGGTTFVSGTDAHRGIEINDATLSLISGVVIENVRIHHYASEGIFIEQAIAPVIRHALLEFLGCFDDGGSGWTPNGVSASDTGCGTWGAAAPDEDNQPGRKTVGVGIEFSNLTVDPLAADFVVRYATKICVQAISGSADESVWPLRPRFVRGEVSYCNDTGIAYVRSQSPIGIDNRVRDIQTPWGFGNINQGMSCNRGGRNGFFSGNLIERTGGIGIQAACGCGVSTGTEGECNATWVNNTIVQACQLDSSRTAISLQNSQYVATPTGRLELLGTRVIDSANCTDGIFYPDPMYTDLVIDSEISAETLASTANGLGASLIGIEDSAAQITATTVEGALAELAASGGGGGYGTVEDEDTPLTQRASLNFEGAGVTCADDTDQTTCTIPGGGGGANSFETVNAPAGTDPVADSATDTLTLTAGAGMGILGDAPTDAVVFFIDWAAATDLDAGGAFSVNSVSADELDEAGVEAPLEAVLDLEDLQGAVTDGQIPAAITRDTELAGKSQATSVDNQILRADGTTGDVQGSACTIDDSGTIDCGAHPTDGGQIAAKEGADDGSNVGGFKVPDGGLTADRICTLEDDATPFDSCVSPASGGVDTSGSPVANDFARFTDADTIEGRSASETRSDLAVPQDIGSGSTVAINPGSITANTCDTSVTTTASGATTSDVVQWSFAQSVGSLTGYAPVSTGGVSVSPYVSAADTITWEICNWTDSALDPDSANVNWRIDR